MRNIKYLVLHCTAGKSTQSTQSIKQYWANTLGWKSYGYHYLISADGTVETLTDESKATNGVKGFNANSIHICYKGGWTGKDTRTAEQKKAIIELLRELRVEYPDAIILGHRDFSPDLDKDGIIEPHEWIKLCPCFDAKEEYKNI